MSKNRSPWIHQLDNERLAEPLAEDVEADVAIVGGGIAGVSTAFFILRNTEKSVVLAEGGRLGHGATGHNAGQVTSYLARSLHDLAKEYGAGEAISAQKATEEAAWELLDVMYTEAGLDIPLSRFTGHLGIAKKAQLFSLLKDNALRKEHGLRPKEIWVARDSAVVGEIQEFDGLFTLVQQEEILKRLETNDRQFFASLSEQKGCMNSALFTEEVAKYLLDKYPDRFSIYEHTHINKVVLHDDCAILDADTHTIQGLRVVLATNGFDSITIFNKSGLDIDTRFHHSIHGVIGYMSGYLDEPVKPPMAISYFISNGELSGDTGSGDPYVYMTRRMYEYNQGKHNLISIGGPDVSLEDSKQYEKDHEYPDWARDELDDLIKKIYAKDKGEKIDYIFTWHGLMGYTTNKLRLIGAEPKNPVLLYNLGCNGVGILPSVYGADRIAKLVKGETPEPTIFDPKG